MARCTSAGEPIRAPWGVSVSAGRNAPPPSPTSPLAPPLAPPVPSRPLAALVVGGVAGGSGRSWRSVSPSPLAAALHSVSPPPLCAQHSPPAPRPPPSSFSVAQPPRRPATLGCGRGEQQCGEQQPPRSARRTFYRGGGLRRGGGGGGRSEGVPHIPLTYANGISHSAGVSRRQSIHSRGGAPSRQRRPVPLPTASMR